MTQISTSKTKSPWRLVVYSQDGPATYCFLAWLKSRKGCDYHYFPVRKLKPDSDKSILKAYIFTCEIEKKKKNPEKTHC